MATTDVTFDLFSWRNAFLTVCPHETVAVALARDGASSTTIGAHVEEHASLSYERDSELLQEEKAHIVKRSVLSGTVNYYVDPVNGDDTNHDGSSPSKAWLTLAYACGRSNSTLSTINLLPGSYSLNVFGTTTSWSVLGAGVDKVNIYLSGSLILASSVVSIKGVTIYNQATFANRPALYFTTGGTVSDVNFILSQGPAVRGDSPPTGSTLNILNVNVTYNVPSNYVPFPSGVFIITAHTNVVANNVQTYGTYFGNLSVWYAEALTTLDIQNSLFTNHSGSTGIIWTLGTLTNLIGSTFINNTVVGTNSSVVTVAFDGSVPNIHIPRVGNTDFGRPQTVGTGSTITTTIQGCHFLQNSAPLGAGAVSFQDSANLVVSIWNSFFDSNSGMVGAVWVWNTKGLKLDNVDISNNVGSLYSGLVAIAAPVTITSVTFSNNSVPFNAAAGLSTSTVLITNGTISSSNFTGSSAPYCPHLLVYNSSGTEISFNLFMPAKSTDTAGVCIIGEASVAGTVLNNLTANNFWDTDFLFPVDRLSTASQLNIWSAHVTIQDYIFGLTTQTDPDVPSVAIGDYSVATIVGDTIRASLPGGRAILPGIITYASVLNLNAFYVEFQGRSAFLTMGDDQGPVNATTLFYSSNMYGNSYLYLQSLSALNGQVDDVYEALQTAAWIQDGYFRNVHVSLERQTIFCCNTGNLSNSLVFDGYPLAAELYHHYYLRNQPMRFVSGAFLAVQNLGTLHVTYPLKDSAEHRPFIGGDAIIGYNGPGVLRVIDADISGNITVIDGQLVLFPSLWRGINHTVTAGGLMQQGGEILLDEKYALLPFLPVITHIPSQTYPILRLPSAQTVDLTQFTSSHMNYSFYVDGSSPMTVYATTHKLIPITKIDDTGSAILMQFLIPPSIPYNCAQLIPSNTTQFDIPSLTCIWQSSNVLRVGSKVLPVKGTLVEIDDTNPEIATPYDVLQYPDNPVPLVSIMRPLPQTVQLCPSTNMTLDASLSLGIGSYGSISMFYFGADSLDPNISVVNAYLQSQFSNMPFSQVPLDLLSPGYSYSFKSIFSTTWAQPADLTHSFSSWSGDYVVQAEPVSLAPTIAIDGLQNRTHFLGTPLDVQARFVPNACSQTQLIIWEWRSSLGSILSNSPHLHLPGTEFTEVTNVSITINAHYSETPSFIATQVLMIEVVHPPPFFLVQESPTIFFDSNITLSVGIRGFNSSGLLDSPTYSWTLYSCRLIDGRQGRVDVTPSIGSRASGDKAAPIFNKPTNIPTCLRDDGSSYPVVLQNPTTPNPSIDYRTIDYGLYVFEAAVTIGDTVMKTNITFTLDHPPGVATTPPPRVRVHLPDVFSTIQSGQRLYFEAEVNDVTGFALTSSWSLKWLILGGVSSSALAVVDTTQPILVIPYSALIHGSIVHIGLEVTSLSDSSVTSNQTVTFNIANIPFGGYLSVDPPSGMLGDTFAFTSTVWSSLYPPMRYQISLAPANDVEKVIAFLTDFVDFPSFEEMEITLPSSMVLENPGGATVDLIATLTVMDAFGAQATSNVPLSITIPPENDVFPSDASLIALAESLEVALNASDWKRGARIAPKLVQALVQRERLANTSFAPPAESADATRALDTLVISGFVDQLHSLSASLPLDAENGARILSLLSGEVASMARIIPLIQVQSAKFEAMLTLLLSSPAVSFGQASGSGLTSTRGFLDVISSLAFNAAKHGLTNGDSLHTLLLNHGGEVLANTISGENPLTHSAQGLFFHAHTKSVSSGTVQITDGGAVVSFDTEQFAANTVSGYVGFHCVQFNGTFPFRMPANAHPVVSIVTMIAQSTASSKRSFASVESSPVSGRVTTNFTTTTLSTTSGPSCSTYDSSTDSWSSSGCTTSSDSSSVSCECDSSSSSKPLTVLFGISSSSSPSSKSKGSSSRTTLIIAVAVSVGGVLLILGVAIAIILSVPSLREKVMPYRGTNG